MQRIYRRINNKILSHNKFVFGYEVQSGRKTACMYMCNNYKKGMILDNTSPHVSPVFEYNIETMIEDMYKVFPNDYIYVAGVQDEEQFGLFRQFGFTMVKINKPKTSKSIRNNWDFLREDMLDYVNDDIWDITIDNTSTLYNLHKEIEKKIIKNYKQL